MILDDRIARQSASEALLKLRSGARKRAHDGSSACFLYPQSCKSKGTTAPGRGGGGGDHPDISARFHHNPANQGCSSVLPSDSTSGISLQDYAQAGLFTKMQPSF